MFSATWPTKIQQISKHYMKDPIHVVIGNSENSKNSNI